VLSYKTDIITIYK